MSGIVERYRGRAAAFERLVAGVAPGQWSNPSPCAEWTARDVVGHVIDMHAAMLAPVGRTPRPAPSLADDPLGVFRAARADVEALLADAEAAATVHDTPGGRVSAADHVDQVASADLVLHGWDLARATGQDDTIDPVEVARSLPMARQMPAEMRIPGAFGPGIVVFGPEVKVPEGAPPQAELLGLLGRDPAWTAGSGTAPRAGDRR